MEFNNYTIEKLKRISEELDFEINSYGWGTDEFEFLMVLCGGIEDALRGGSDDSKRDLFKIATEYAATKPEDREDDIPF